jgi:hypothetical protein
MLIELKISDKKERMGRLSPPRQPLEPAEKQGYRSDKSEDAQSLVENVDRTILLCFHKVTSSN